MKIRYSVFLIVAFWISSTYVNGQIKPLWTRKVTEGIRWQMVTPLGHYIAGTSQGIIGINPDKGDVIWKNTTVGAITPDRVQQVGSSPLISVSTATGVYMIDPYTGEIRFDSKVAGVTEVKDQKVLYLSNGILVSGRNTQNKDVLMMSSLDNGTVAWKIEDDFGRLVAAQELAPDALLLVTLYYNYKVNPRTGQVIWKNDVSEANAQMAKLGGFGALVKQAGANAAQNMQFNVRFYKHPSRPMFFIASEQEGKAETSGFTSSTSTGGGPSYHTTYMAFDINDGKRLWAKPLDITGKMGPVHFDEKGLVVMPDDGSNTKINMYDYTTQAGMWGKKGKGVSIKGGIYSYMKTNEGLILVSKNANGKNFISIFNLATQTLTFEKPVTVDGEVVYSESTPKGLLYITTEEVNILNVTTGAVLIPKGIRSTPRLWAQKENMLFVFDLNESVVKSLDKSTGAIRVASAPVKFEGKEVPAAIELREKGILVSSSQNLALFDYEGKQIYQKYFEAPREPGLIRALQYAQAVRATYIGAASYSAAATFQSAGEQTKSEDPMASSLYTGIGQAYNELGNAATDFAKKSWQQASARFKATKDGGAFTVVLTKQDKNNVLIKIDKDTGNPAGVIDLGKETSPDYVMDGVTGQVFYNTAGTGITAYRF
jgi:hypothetical protein